ncbi:MAG: hypothetical protein U5N26_11595 [Candidatus Marinimicrobia bacterium]|nr:hypothetical protein [Candidatus Neomarinimicrobiota bacterium]
MFSAVLLFAKNKAEDVIYLHDGTIITGTIIEHIPNESIKILEEGGSVFVYKVSEIKKVTKKENKYKFAKKNGVGLQIGRLYYATCCYTCCYSTTFEPSINYRYAYKQGKSLEASAGYHYAQYRWRGGMHNCIDILLMHKWHYNITKNEMNFFWGVGTGIIIAINDSVYPTIAFPIGIEYDFDERFNIPLIAKFELKPGLPTIRLNIGFSYNF